MAIGIKNTHVNLIWANGTKSYISFCTFIIYIINAINTESILAINKINAAILVDLYAEFFDPCFLLWVKVTLLLLIINELIILGLLNKTSSLEITKYILFIFRKINFLVTNTLDIFLYKIIFWELFKLSLSNVTIKFS